MLEVAFWNVNTGPGSPAARQALLGTIVQSLLPDLFFLEEVGTFSQAQLETLTGYEQIGAVNTLNVRGGRTSKRLVVLQPLTGTYGARALRFPGLRARRASIMAYNTDRTSPHANLMVWGLHANASVAGGRAANVAANAYLQTWPDHVVGGDFNLDITHADAAGAVHPLAWDGTNLQFTQWDKDGGATIGPGDPHLANFHLPANGDPSRVYHFRPLTHNVIDYAKPGANVALAARRNAASAHWMEMLAEFDHCPVRYRVP